MTYLTPKETEVVRLVVLGRTRKEIAFELGIAYATLDTHMKHIFMKLQTRGTLETAIYAIQHHLVD